MTVGFSDGCASATIAQEAEDAKSLQHIRQRAQPTDYNLALIHTLASLLAQLHNSRYNHSDVTMNNFLVRHDGNRRPQLVVIDLDPVRPVRLLTARSAVQDLRRLVRRVPMSPLEQKWFVTEYCQKRLPPRDPLELVSRLNLDPALFAARQA